MAVDRNTAFADIVKTRNQGNQRGLTAAGRTDKSNRFPFAHGKADILEHRFFPVGIGKCHMVKSDLIHLMHGQRLFLFADRALCGKHFFDPFCGYISTGIHHEDHAEQHHGKHCMEQIFHESHQLADLQRIGIDHTGRNIINGKRRQIHHQKKDRFRRRHQLEQAA